MMRFAYGPLALADDHRLIPTSITDVGLRQLAALKHDSMVLVIDTTKITGAAGFDAFAGRKFSSLGLGQCPISREGWSRISDLKLVNLFGGSSNQTDDTLTALVNRQPNLQTIQAHDNRLTDAVLEPVSRLAELRESGVYGTGVTDKGLAYLEKTKTLTHLKAESTKVTAAGVARLQMALPMCKIEWDGPPLDFPDIKTPRELAEWTLRVGGRVNAGASGEAKGVTAEQIAAKDFQLWAVRYDNVKAIDDDAIAHMVRWPLPDSIGLIRTSITDEGLRQLAALKHDSMAIVVNTTKVTGSGFDAFAGARQHD